MVVKYVLGFVSLNAGEWLLGPADYSPAVPEVTGSSPRDSVSFVLATAPDLWLWSWPASPGQSWLWPSRRPLEKRWMGLQRTITGPGNPAWSHFKASCFIWRAHSHGGGGIVIAYRRGAEWWPHEGRVWSVKPLGPPRWHLVKENLLLPNLSKGQWMPRQIWAQTIIYSLSFIKGKQL